MSTLEGNDAACGVFFPPERDCGVRNGVLPGLPLRKEVQPRRYECHLCPIAIPWFAAGCLIQQNKHPAARFPAKNGNFVTYPVPESSRLILPGMFPKTEDDMLYPIGIQNFEMLPKMGYVYVDKTEKIHRLVSTGKHYLLLRPKRFGKSILEHFQRAG